MKLKDFLDMCNTNAHIVINDNEMKRVIGGLPICTFIFHFPNMLEKDVVSFGFHDNELIIRLNDLFPYGNWEFDKIAKLDCAFNVE